MGEHSGGRLAWLRAGQELLRSGGHQAVKLDALREESGLSTGSFYHHFSGIREYRAELARSWGAEFLDQSLTPLEADDPAERLVNISRLSSAGRVRILYASMRAWAEHDSVAAAAVQRADETMLTFMAEAFEGLGFTTAEARFRAQLYLASGTVRMTTPWATELTADRVLTLLSERPH